MSPWSTPVHCDLFEGQVGRDLSFSPLHNFTVTKKVINVFLLHVEGIFLPSDSPIPSERGRQMDSTLFQQQVLPTGIHGITARFAWASPYSLFNQRGSTFLTGPVDD